MYNDESVKAIEFN